MRLVPVLLSLTAACGDGEIAGALVELTDAGRGRSSVDASAALPDAASIRLDAASLADAAMTSRPDASAPAPRCGDSVCTETCSACPADCGACGWPEPLARSEEAVLGLVNQLRARGAICGGATMESVAPLRMSPELREAARLHSADMGAQNYFDHASLDGRNFAQRAFEAGYQGQPVAENIAGGSSTAEAAFDQWERSAGHCRNMMSATANEIGLGHAFDQRGRWGDYWTMVLGRR